MEYCTLQTVLSYDDRSWHITLLHSLEAYLARLLLVSSLLKCYNAENHETRQVEFGLSC